jgi:16S rRNA (cytidine1402-2'-O)-methyltransferase
MTAELGAGTLVLVATPIGNLGDLSPRALEALAHADIVCCEDTRRTRGLLTHAGLRGVRLLSLHEHNEMARVDTVLTHLAQGKTVAVVSDAGTPLVSDPGGRLVSAAVAAGATVTAVPGPSAALTALVVSGLPSERFCFEGFLPRRGGDRRRRIEAVGHDARTAVIFEAPGRLAATLGDLLEVCGPDRAVVVARELTKLHEEVWRGALGDACATFAARDVRGEVVVVLAGDPDAGRAPDDTRLQDALRGRIERGDTLRDAATAVAGELGVSRRRAYDLALEMRQHERNSRNEKP